MAEIRLSRIKSSAFKISSYAGPSVHIGEKSYQCRMCNKSFLGKWRFSDHVKRHISQKLHNKIFGTTSLAQQVFIVTTEDNVNKLHVCVSCNRTFLSEESLSRHVLSCNVVNLRNKHVLSRNDKYPAEEQRNIPVLSCNEKYPVQDLRNVPDGEFCDLNELIERGLVGQNDNITKAIVDRNENQVRSCIGHIHIWTNNIPIPYQCDQCNKAFSIECDLREHTCTHTSEKPHQCGSLTSSSSHEEDKPFVNDTLEYPTAHEEQPPSSGEKTGNLLQQFDELLSFLNKYFPVKEETFDLNF